ncbi:MAG: hypothetical protein LBU03_02395 [Tannerellaceae bacterium]|jgi:hypothetical protein|nr:hypothetical protein [Tannerellaceae bacterium]
MNIYEIVYFSLLGMMGLGVLCGCWWLTTEKGQEWLEGQEEGGKEGRR